MVSVSLSLSLSLSPSLPPSLADLALSRLLSQTWPYSRVFSLSRRGRSSGGYTLDPAEAGPRQLRHVQLKKKVKVLVTQLYPTLCDPMVYGPPGSLSMEFSRQEYWSGLPFPPPEDIPDPGIEPMSPALTGGFFIIEAAIVF